MAKARPSGAASRVWYRGALALSGIVSVVTFFLPADWSSDLLAPFSLARFVFMLAFLGLVLGAVARSEGVGAIPSMTRGVRVLWVIIPALVVTAAVLQWVNRDLAVWLVRYEIHGWNFRHAIFVKAAFELAAGVLFVWLSLAFARRQVLGAAAVSGVLAFVAFVMVGEELSWGQRIFEWVTPPGFAEVNAQGEMNLHNLATQLFQNVWYFGCWLLLVVIPFFRLAIERALARSKRFGFLCDFLPPSWFVLVFASAYALVDPLKSPTGLRYGSILFSILGTAAMLAYLIVRRRTSAALLPAAAFLVALYFELFWSQSWDSNQGVPTEYLEVFLAFGILCWAVRVRKQVKLPRGSFTDSPLAHR